MPGLPKRKRATKPGAFAGAQNLEPFVHSSPSPPGKATLVRDLEKCNMHNLQTRNLQVAQLNITEKITDARGGRGGMPGTLHPMTLAFWVMPQGWGSGVYAARYNKFSGCATQGQKELG